MKLFVAVTDNDWFQFLASRPALDEVNFWTPSGKRLAQLSPGQPVLFKLHHPEPYIAGGGFFATFSVLPISIAWETFGEKNGAATLQEMRTLIERRRHHSALPHEDYDIGCTILVEPFFLDRRDWILEPSDFAPTIVRGKTYSLATAEGRDLWQRVLQGRRTRTGASAEAPAAEVFGDPTLVPRRLGQGAFRVLVTDTYARRCAVTREKVLPVLQAAHIRPVSQGGTHSLPNGLLLRSDIHTLFDRGYVTVTPTLKFLASQRLKKDFHNGEYYLALSGAEVWVPPDETKRPAKELLEWHADTVFKG
jgi:putative restriction endonuclease